VAGRVWASATWPKLAASTALVANRYALDVIVLPPQETWRFISAPVSRLDQ